MSEMIKLGPVGNTRFGVTVWDEMGRSQIYQIFISYGVDDLLNGLQFQYLNCSGSLVLSDLFGSMDGSNFKMIKLDCPSEYITWVKIKESVWTVSGGIQWLAFKTNLGNLYGPFPPTYRNRDSMKREQHVVNDVNDLFAREFDLGKDNQFGGFHGSSDRCRISSLGIYAHPLSKKTT
ncbi:unnamed protein product [Rhodiola kirilowii]